MRAASAFLFTGILALSASFPHATFRYELRHSLRRTEDDCRICYEDDCIEMDEARCEYYVEADEIMEKPEQDGDVTVVDDLINDLTEQASMSWAVQSCVPLISYYTNCDKENLCIGCKTCHCTEAGTWICRQVQRCRADAPLDVDHRTLLMVQEKLMEREKKARKKRLVENITNKTEVKPISFVDIAKWMYGVTPNVGTGLTSHISNTENAVKGSVNQTESAILSRTTSSTPTEYEYLGFEEVLKNIDIEDQKYKRRKPQLKDVNTTFYDYMDSDDYKVINSNSSNQFMSVLKAIEEGKDVTESIDDATFVVDLFPRAKKNDYYDDNSTTDNVDINNDIYKEENNTINTSNSEIELDSTNIMKRDVSAVIDLNSTTQRTSLTISTFETTTEKENELKNNVLIPLTNIIDDKQNEVKELLQIKDNLLRFFNLYYSNTEVNITKEPEKNNNSNTYFSIYKLDLFPEIQASLRKTDQNALDKMLYKLKRDIYEVLRDISWIQMISKTHGVPDDLKILIRSMKYYVNKQGNIRNFAKTNIQLDKYKNNSRRTYVNLAPKSIKRQLINILEVLDKETPQSNSLMNLSKSTKKIIMRVVKQNYVNEFSKIGIRVFDSEYNLTSDLRTIGKSWPQMTANVANSSPHEKLYAMKLLHFSLAADINKLTDAISLIDFAHSRRMSPIETPMAEQLMDKINSGLTIIKNKVESLMQSHTVREKKILREKPDISEKKIIKESFLKKLRNMLRSSKKDIIDMAKKKIPKSQIFKTIAKKKLNELTQKKMYEDEQTMLKWEKKLNIAQRKKRELRTNLSSIKKRIKNIIPKYLRGKVNPAIAKHKSKHQSGTKKTNKQKSHNTTSRTTTSSIETNSTNKHN